jgi:hypothetical protein
MTNSFIITLFSGKTDRNDPFSGKTSLKTDRNDPENGICPHYLLEVLLLMKIASTYTTTNSLRTGTGSRLYRRYSKSCVRSD